MPSEGRQETPTPPPRSWTGQTAWLRGTKQTWDQAVLGGSPNCRWEGKGLTSPTGHGGPTHPHTISQMGTPPFSLS